MKVYLIGIAGTAMGAFAGLLKQAGHEVTGSDNAVYPPMNDKLQEWGIEARTPYQASNLNADIDLVVVGNVVSKNHVEAQEAKNLGLKCQSFPETLAQLFIGDKRSLVAAGTHGKTTCSALLAHVLMHAGKDPSFLMGGIPQNFKESFRLGKGPFFVVEGDEYDTAYFDKGPKFLHYKPFYLLCSSLEYDHADIYDNVDQIVERFSQVISLVPKEGTVVLNTNFPELKKALAKSKLKASLVEYSEPDEWSESASGLRMMIDERPVEVGLSGRHGAQNALGCYRILQAAGLSHDEIASGFKTFKGVKRRLEVIGEKNGVTIIDDFAHHPTAVRLTLEGAKKRYQERPVWALFEPRSTSSCRSIFQDDYAKSFEAADQVLLAPCGRQLDPAVSLDVKKLASDIGKKAAAFDSIDDIVSYAKKHVSPKAVLLCMSNGSFGGIHKRLLEGV
ncbi:MAG: UDP-N-acetylmuramate dehydrogenase [Deltaproteobacteria bacterium]|nr:UDP-N-acetylmuramate dehydrogenase [Deltaproteobacteria bacterium]